MKGYERESNKDLIKFLHYAKGSAGELRTQLHIGVDIGYIDKATGHHLAHRSPTNQQNASSPNQSQKIIHPNPLPFSL